MAVSFPRLALAFGVLLLAAGAVLGQTEENIFNPTGGLVKQPGFETEKKLTVTAKLEPVKARRGTKILLKLTLEPGAGYHIYPFKQDDPAVEANVTTVKVDSKAVALTGEVKAPPPDKVAPAPEFNAKALAEWEHKVEAELSLLVRPEVAPGFHEVKVRVSGLVCDASNCTPIDEKATLKLEVTDEPPLEGAKTPVPAPTGEPAAPAAGTNANSGKHSFASSGLDPKLLPGIYEGIAKQIEAVTISGAAAATANELLPFVITGALWGLISLLTPCVFPMIPITVSFFLKQSESQHHRPLAMASVYCATIVTVLTLSAVFLLSVMQIVSQHPAMNFFLGGLFLFFAFSLFGWYEIELPTSLTRFTSSREGQGGYAGTIFMALTFTIISFACVAPFLGTFAGTQTQNRPWLHIVLGALAFSATFAAPFFLLALFPGLLRKMPKSGSWLNSVKVVMGFLEVAAALGFLRAGELTLMSGQPTSFFTYDLVLSLWIVLCALCGFYLLNLYRTPHDSPNEHLSVPRLLWAIVFLGLAVYLTPALWKKDSGQRQRPAGGIYAWIDAFLLEEPGMGGHGEAWSGNLAQALEDARAHTQKTGKRKLIFIDFTGRICKNCRLNELNVFPNPRIQALFRQFQLVQLRTDVVDSEEDIANKDFERTAFGTLELPLYVILEPLPNGKIKRWGQVGGLITNVDSFVQFLETPLANGGDKAVAAK